MPLHVHCPSGCEIRMSRNKSGKVVRCPECKSAIRVPVIAAEELANADEPIPCHAKFAKKTNKPKTRVSNEKNANSRLEVPLPGLSSRKVSQSEQEPTTHAPSPPTSSDLRAMVDPQQHQVDLSTTPPESGFTFEFPRSPPAPVPVVGLQNSEQTMIQPQPKNWESRLRAANDDRVLLCRIFAVCLCCVAIVNMVPAIYHWTRWTGPTESGALPRWIYIQVFVGAVYFVYAMFLSQVPDWSAMRAVSFAMLFSAFVFGGVSTGLIVGGGQSDLSGFLGIPYTLSRQACIWCVAMLCLATLMAYWAGKESLNWQRAEGLLNEILKKSAATI